MGWENSRGYLQARVLNRQALVHRLVWILHHGAIPEGYEVDHINRDRKDNRIENLQLLDLRSHRQKDTREGVANVARKLPACVYERNGRYRVIKNNKCYGTFDTVEQARERLQNLVQ